MGWGRGDAHTHAVEGNLSNQNRAARSVPRTRRPVFALARSSTKRTAPKEQQQSQIYRLPAKNRLNDEGIEAVKGKGEDLGREVR
jgi:predicted secreted protein